MDPRKRYAQILKLQREMLDAVGEANLTEEQQDVYDKLDEDRADVKTQIDRLDALEAAEAEERESARLHASAGRKADPDPPANGGDGGDGGGEQRVVIPRACGRIRSFQTIEGEKPAHERAYRYGVWLGALAGNEECVQRASDLGIELRAQTEGTNTAGGFAVPNEFVADWIVLVETFGAFRQNADIHPMTSDTASTPRQTSDVTITLVGENESGTESDIAIDQVNLTARKWMGITKISNELSEDSLISIGDKVMQSHARGYAAKEDDLGWAGDASAGDGGIHGINPRLIALNGVDDGGGLVLGAGNDLSEITFPNFHDMVGILPDYAEPGAKWYASKWVFSGAMQRLAAEAGGSTWEQIADGSRKRMFMGYEVVIVSGTVFPKSNATSQILCNFGDLAQSSTLGDRRAMTVRVTETGDDAIKDLVTVISTARWDINNHDLGTASDAGPIVGLISAAS